MRRCSGRPALLRRCRLTVRYSPSPLGGRRGRFSYTSGAWSNCNRLYCQAPTTRIRRSSRRTDSGLRSSPARKLKKISVTGGATVTLADVPTGRGAWWADDDTIVFVPAREGVGLMRISSSGGTPTPIASLADGEVTQRWPQVLPGSKAVLFTGHSSPAGGFDNANLVVQTLPAGPRKTVQRGGLFGRYLTSGHLLYIHEGTLFVAPFDPDRLELSGQGVPVIERVISNPGSGSAQFAFSSTGTLVYATGQSVQNDAPIHWMDRQGRATPLRSTPASWRNLRFSPDGSRLAVEVSDGPSSDVWIADWARDTFSRMTSHPGADTRPVGTPDGRRIVFSSDRANRGTPNLDRQHADGTGGCTAVDREWQPPGAGLLAPGRQVPSVPARWWTDRRRPAHPAHGGRRSIGLETGQADNVPRQPFRRTGRDVFARRTLARGPVR